MKHRVIVEGFHERTFELLYDDEDPEEVQLLGDGATISIPMVLLQMLLQAYDLDVNHDYLEHRPVRGWQEPRNPPDRAPKPFRSD